MTAIIPPDMADDRTRSKRERWWRSAFIVLATIYVALLLIGLLVQILGGFAPIGLIVFTAWLLAFVLSPLVTWLTERTRLPRGAAIGLVYLVTLVVSGFLVFYAASSIASNMGEMTEDYPLTRARIEGSLLEWEDAISFGRFEPNLVDLYRELEATGQTAFDSVVGEAPAVTIAVLGAMVLVIILSLYMVADSARILAGLHRVVPDRWEREVEIGERTISTAFGGFLRAQVLLAGVQTLLTVAVVLIADLPYGFLITAISALAMLIPFFGPPLALIPPIVATAIFSPEWLIPVAVVLIAVQTVLVNYLQPRLMRDALGMHPLLVLVGLLVGAQVAGVWGALFGIPILAVANVFFNYVVNLRRLEEAPEVELEEVLEEVRSEVPEAAPEEVVAIAAERVDEENGDAGVADRIAKERGGQA